MRSTLTTGLLQEDIILIDQASNLSETRRQVAALLICACRMCSRSTSKDAGGLFTITKYGNQVLELSDVASGLLTRSRLMQLAFYLKLP